MTDRVQCPCEDALLNREECPDPDCSNYERLHVRHATSNSAATWIVELIASELALIDKYDPNDHTPAEWAAAARDYESKAQRIVGVLIGTHAIPKREAKGIVMACPQCPTPGACQRCQYGYDPRQDATRNSAATCVACGTPCPPGRRWCSQHCYELEDGPHDDEAGDE